MSEITYQSSRKTVLEIDLVAYSDVARMLEENLSVDAVKLFEDQVQEFVDHGLKVVGLQRDDVVLGTAGDNAILIFDDAVTMHRFAQAVQSATLVHNDTKSIELAKRWFRMGAATGMVILLPLERRIVGTTIARAVRLEAAADKGHLVIDLPTFQELPADLKACYGSEEVIKGKRDERFQGRRCTLIEIPLSRGEGSHRTGGEERRSFRKAELRSGGEEDVSQSRGEVSIHQAGGEERLIGRGPQRRGPVPGGSSPTASGSTRNVTIMFADLSGFTVLSTKVGPAELMAVTNAYLGIVAEAVEATGGYVDKFIGDSVMGMWGAPVPNSDHAALAARAALRAQQGVLHAKSEADARGKLGFSVKMGLNTGSAVVGNLGAPGRYNYTALGETVNIAARLEGAPGDYGCRIVVGPQTREAIADRFVLCELDWIRVKGKEEQIAIYELLAEHRAGDAAMRAYCADYGAALERYRAGDFAAAQEIWRRARHPLHGDTASSPPLVMAQRCADLIKASR